MKASHCLSETVLRNQSLRSPCSLAAGKQQRDVPRAPYLSDSKSVCSSNSTIWRFSLCLRTSLVGFQNISAFPLFNSFICTSPSWEGKLSEKVNDNQKHKAENNPDKWKLLPADDLALGLVRRLLSSSIPLNLTEHFLKVSKTREARHSLKHWLNNQRRIRKGHHPFC